MDGVVGEKAPKRGRNCPVRELTNYLAVALVGSRKSHVRRDPPAPRHDITDSWVRVSWRLRGDGTCQSNLLRDILQPDACLGYAHHDLAGQVPAARKQDPIGFLLACDQVPVEAEPDPLGPVFLQTTARESRHDGRGRMRTHSFSEPVLGCSVPSPTGSVTVATQSRAASSASHASAQCECMPTGEARNLSRTFVQASIRGVD